MSSIKKEISHNTIANEIRMLRSMQKGAFLIVEGDGDVRFFAKHLGISKDQIVIGFGKERVINVVFSLEGSGFQGVVGVVDKDFWDFHPPKEIPNNIVVVSEQNDIEIMLLLSPALDDVLREFGSAEKCEAARADGEEGIAKSILKEGAKIGIIRLISERDDCSLKFDEMKYQFKDNSSMIIDLRRTVEHILGRSEKKISAEDLMIEVNRLFNSLTDFAGYCSGHDCVRVLGRALKSYFGSDNQFDSEKRIKNLEKILRLASDREWFYQTNIFADLRCWEEKSGYSLM